MKLKKEILNKIIGYFSKKSEIAAVYLFGSFARGDARSLSDIDLGIVFRKKTQKAFALPEIKMANELGNLLEREVEIQDLLLCRIDFAHRVISAGRLIYSGDEKARVEFEEKILRDFFDLKPMLDEYYSYLSQMAGRGELDARYIQD